MGGFIADLLLIANVSFSHVRDEMERRAKPETKPFVLC